MTARPRPSSRSVPTSTTGAGPACRSTCVDGQANGGARSEIIVQFKDVPHDVVGASNAGTHPNRLIIRLQPDEGVKLMLTTKDPGPGGLRLRYVPLNLSYAEHFDKDYPGRL